MGFNDRYKGGPTLDSAERQGATHLQVSCNKIGCGQTDRIALNKVTVGGKPAPRNVPVNHLELRCPKCKGIHFSVGLVFPDKPTILVQVVDLKNVKPKSRRKVRAG